MAIIRLDFNAFSSLSKGAVEEIVNEIKKGSYDIIKKSFKNKENKEKINNIIQPAFKKELRKEMESRDQFVSGNVYNNTNAYIYDITIKKDSLSLNINAGTDNIPSKDRYSYYNTEGRKFTKMDVIMEWVKRRVEMGSIKAVTSFSKERGAGMSQAELIKRVSFAIYNKEKAYPEEQQKRRSNRYIKSIVQEEIKSKNYSTGKIVSFFTEKQLFRDTGSLVHDFVMERVLGSNLSAIVGIITNIAGKKIKQYIHTDTFWQKERIGRLYGREAKKAFSLLNKRRIK